MPAIQVELLPCLSFCQDTKVDPWAGCDITEMKGTTFFLRRLTFTVCSLEAKQTCAIVFVHQIIALTTILAWETGALINFCKSKIYFFDVKLEATLQV